MARHAERQTALLESLHVFLTGGKLPGEAPRFSGLFLEDALEYVRWKASLRKEE